MADNESTSETPSQEQMHTESSPQDKTETNIVVTRGVAKRKRRASSIDSTSHNNSNNNNTESEETVKKRKTCSSSEQQQQQQQQSASESGDPVAEAGNANNAAKNTTSMSEEASSPEAPAVPTISSPTTKGKDADTTNNNKVKDSARQDFDSSADAKKRANNFSKRWRVHQMAEDYVDLVSSMMLFPTTHLGPYGYSDNHHQGNGDSGAPPSSTMARQQQQRPKSYPLELISSLGFLKSPLRRPTIIEKWSPYEVSLFEAGIGHYGKDFHQIHKVIQSKSTKEVIDFYYIWKKTSHYKMWKKEYVAPGEILSDEEFANTTNTPLKKPAR